jgi:hypothetical protein
MHRKSSLRGHAVCARTVHALLCVLALACAPLNAATGPAEKEDLRFGFIKLTDMVPLAIAYERGYFEDEGLFVTLEAQANWKVLLDRVITGELDGAHMLAGQPIGATVGFGTEAHVVTAFTMDLNGNACTVSNDVWQAMKKQLPMNDGKPVHRAAILRKALQYQRLAGGVLCLHEEDPTLSGRGVMHEGDVSARLGLAGIPSVSESDTESTSPFFVETFCARRTTTRASA